MPWKQPIYRKNEIVGDFTETLASMFSFLLLLKKLGNSKDIIKLLQDRINIYLVRE